MNNEWLNNLKVGDTVFISQSYGVAPRQATVSRLTKAHIFVKVLMGSYEEDFWRKDGYMVGGNAWNHNCLIQNTEETRERVLIEKLKNKVNSMRNKLPTPNDKDTLIQLIEALKPFVKED